jgi:glycerate dehydrogenase
LPDVSELFQALIAVDGYTLNPGDNPWDSLASFGSLAVFDRTEPELLIERCREADVLLTNKTPLRADTLNALPRLKYLVVLAAGYDVVDIAAAGARGVAVSNTPAYGVEAVAQHAMALLLELARNVGMHDASVKRGEWASAPDWCYWLKPQRELTGMVLGIVGFGNNGRRMGELAHAFGMEIVSSTVPPVDAPPYKPFRFVDLDELFRVSDVISLHCPLLESTRHIISKSSISRMKPGALLINTARGPLVNEEDVAAALHTGQLGGFATDVLPIEPPTSDNPLLRASNVIITPHIAWATLHARKNIVSIAVEDVRGFLEGKPVNVVNSAYLQSA